MSGSIRILTCGAICMFMLWLHVGRQYSLCGVQLLHDVDVSVEHMTHHPRSAVQIPGPSPVAGARNRLQVSGEKIRLLMDCGFFFFLNLMSSEWRGRIANLGNTVAARLSDEPF